MPADSSAAQENIDHLLLGRKEGDKTLPNFTKALEAATTPEEIHAALHGISEIATKVVKSLGGITPHETVAEETLHTPEQKRENKNKETGNQDLKNCQDLMATIPELISRTQNGFVTSFESLQKAALALATVVNKAGEAVGSAIGGHEAPSEIGQTHTAVTRFTSEARNSAAKVESYNEGHPPFGVIMSDLAAGKREIPEFLKALVRKDGMSEEDIKNSLLEKSSKLLAAALIDPDSAKKALELEDGGPNKAFHKGKTDVETAKPGEEAEKPNIFTLILQAMAAVINSVAKLIGSVASAIAPDRKSKDPILQALEDALETKTARRVETPAPTTTVTIDPKAMEAAITAASAVIEALKGSNEAAATLTGGVPAATVATPPLRSGGGRE
jgi:hypothetical protein